MKNSIQRYVENSFRRNFPDTRRRARTPVRNNKQDYAKNSINGATNFKKPYKLSSVIKYQEFANSSTEISELFLGKFINIRNMHLIHGSLEDILLKHLAYFSAAIKSFKR